MWELVTWILWGLIFGAGALLEAVTIFDKRRDDTLTEKTRKTFFVRHPLGEKTFIVVWVGFSLWFLGHILQWWS